MKWTGKAALCLAVLLAAGCSSGTAADTSQKTDTAADKEQTAEKTETAADTASDTQSSALSAADKGMELQKAFESEGYSVSDIENEDGGREYSFTALNDKGAVDVDVAQFADQNAAVYEYNDEIEIEADDDDYALESFSNGNYQWSITTNYLNSEYQFTGADLENFLVFQADNISEANLEQVKKIFIDFGFSQ